MLNFLKRFKIIIIFSLITIAIIPFSLYKPAETEKVAVITSIGIDKNNEEIELSANVIVPNSGASGGSGGGGDGTVKTVSAKGNDITSAFSNLTLILGKMPGLSHCDSIILNKNLFEENVTKYLDYFVRTNNLTSNATVIVAENKASEIIETSAAQKDLRAVSLSEVLTLSDEYSIASNSNVDSFYTNYFSAAGVSILPVLTAGESNTPSGQTKENSQNDSTQSSKTENFQNSEESNLQSSSTQKSGTDGGSESGLNSSSSSGSNSSSSSGSDSSSGGSEPSTQSSQTQSESGSGAPQKIVKNEGKAVVVKNGKIVYDLPGVEVQGLNLISSTTKKGHIKIEDVTNDLFENATLNFEIFNKDVKTTGYFINGLPIFNFKFNLVLKLEEVAMNNFNIEAMKITHNFVSGQIKEKINESVQKSISELINSSKKNKTDTFKVYDYFYKYHNTEWLNFIKSLEDKDDYLNYVTFTCDIKSQGKI